jgi:peptidoglycan hydrolase-like protein with peptidoglycan-binding domain
VTGALDEGTFKHLEDVQTRARKSQKSGNAVFGAGQKDAMILGAEKRLRRLGYDTGKVDGVFDKATREAMRAYQTDQGKKEFKKPGSLLGEKTRKSLAREDRALNHAPERRRTTQGLKQHKRLDRLTAEAAGRC